MALDLEDQAMLDAVAAAKAQPEVAFVLPYHVAMGLVGQLQLALRHPSNDGRTAEDARVFALAIIEQLAVTPALRELLMRGFDPRHDAPAKGGA